MAVDLNDAPKGYFAAQWVFGCCNKCAFRSASSCPRNDNDEFWCFVVNRKDHKDVYFVKKPESTKQDSVPTIHLNISLRDFFAGCAISGFMNASEEVCKVPERAYIVADMMLAEREKSLKEGKGEK